MNFYLNLPNFIIEKAQKIKLLIMDVDGVLSDGKIYFISSGEETKSFSIKDGLGIVLLHQNNIKTSIITGRNDACVESRAKNLQINYYFAGKIDKKIAFSELLKQSLVSTDECAYIGDDIIDLPIMNQVGFAIAVKDAHPTVKTKAHYITENKGGEGAVREVCDIILYAQNKLQTSIEHFFN